MSGNVSTNLPPVVPDSSIINAANSFASAASAFASAGLLFFTFCQLVGFFLVVRGFYLLYGMGDERRQVTGWMVLTSFLVGTALYYLQGLLRVLHNTFPGLFPNI